MAGIKSVKLLKEEGISAEVINIHTIKPLDKKVILDSVKKTKCVVTRRTSNEWRIRRQYCQLLCRELPTPIEMVAVDDSFGESGPPMKLMEKYGLTKNNIVASVKKVIIRK